MTNCSPTITASAMRETWRRQQQLQQQVAGTGGGRMRVPPARLVEAGAVAKNKPASPRASFYC